MFFEIGYSNVEIICKVILSDYKESGKVVREVGRL
jgi:hypothetical protein